MSYSVEQERTEEMARPKQCRGGCIATYPEYVRETLIDLKALRRDIEHAQAMARDTSQSVAVRRRWERYGNQVEDALDTRIELMGDDANGHIKAIEGNVTAMCRQGERHDPSVAELGLAGIISSWEEGPEAA